MGLRETLENTLQSGQLHACIPRPVQLCNSRPNHATANATGVQLTAALRRAVSATGNATPVQLGSCTAPDDGATDAKAVARFVSRRDRLLAWGWAEGDAEVLAARLTNRDRDDDRVSCTECRHYRPGRCVNYSRAGLSAADVGRDLAAAMQRCAGFETAHKSTS